MSGTTQPIEVKGVDPSVSTTAAAGGAGTTFLQGQSKGVVRKKALKDLEALESASLTGGTTGAQEALISRLAGRIAAPYKRDHDAAMASLDPVGQVIKNLTVKRATCKAAQETMADFVKQGMASGQTLEEAEILGSQFASALTIMGRMNSESLAPSRDNERAWNSYFGRGGTPGHDAPRKKKKKKSKEEKE